MYLFQYLFGGEDFDYYQQRDLHKFLEYAKTHIEMNALIEKAFATAAKAETWISMAIVPW